MTDWRQLIATIDEARTLDAAAAQARLGETIPDDALRTRADEILRSLGPRPGFMQTRAPADDGADPASGDALPTGARVGVWAVETLIGRGGMGEVYRARRADGLYDQTVALKIIRGLSAARAARFQAERQRLARMEHPGVARIVDGGQAPDGRPYMAMEFVAGAPITAHADARKLGRKARLDLFVQLCQAVAHAHARLVLHKDIKADNVLVDERGLVRLIDFGIASGVDDDETAGMAMSLATAAPEQLEGKPVTVQTDVFGLGVLLHHLVTGRMPERQADGGMAADLRALASRDLAAILGRALATDPAERYPSVDVLREEIEAVLARRPVEARGSGAGYRFGRFVQRYPLGSGLAAALALALAAGLGFSLDFATKARAEAERAEAALADAEWQYEFANANLMGQSAFMDLLLQSFSGEDNAAGALTEKLMGVWRTEHERWRDSPDATAALSFAVGRSFMMRRDYASTLAVYEAWLAEDYGPESLKSTGRELYAMTMFDAGRRDDAVPLLRHTLEEMQSGPKRMAVDHFNVAMRIASHTRAPDDIALAEALLAQRLAETEGLQANPLEQMETLASKMQIARMTENEAGTVEALEALLALFDRHPEIANRGRDLVRANLADILLYSQGRLEAAEALLTAIVDVDAAELGENAATARATRMLTDLALAKGDAADVLAWVERAIALEAQFLGGPAEGGESLRLRRAVGLANTGRAEEARSTLAEIAETEPVYPLERLLLSNLVALGLGEAPDAVTARLRTEIPTDVQPTKVELFFFRRLESEGVGPVPGFN